MPTPEIVEQLVRTKFHDPNDPFSIPLTYQQESCAREQSLTLPRPTTITIGLGPGGVALVDDRSRAGHHVFAFDSAPTPSGRLPLVSPEKGLYSLGLTEAFKVLTRQTVHARLNTHIDPTGYGNGLSLPDLVQQTGATEVFFGTGTTERHTKLTNGHDLGEYLGHAYAYELIDQMNDWMAQGKNLADFPVEFDPSGEAVIISGAGLVSLEDMGKLILGYQLAVKLRENGIDITQQENKFAQIKLASQPLSTLVAMYKDQGETGEKLRQWLGNDLVLTGQNAGQTLLTRLHEHGIKPTIILYRKSLSEHVKKDASVKLTATGKPDNRLTEAQLEGLGRVGGYKMEYSKEPGSVTLNGNRIKTLTLIERDYTVEDRDVYTVKNTYRPALVISALGGESPNIMLGHDQVLKPEEPIQIGKVIYAVVGNAVKAGGNRAASIASTNEVIAKVANLHRQNSELPPARVVETVEYLRSLGHAPSNLILESLRQISPLLLEKWDLGKAK